MDMPSVKLDNDTILKATIITDDGSEYETFLAASTIEEIEDVDEPSNLRVITTDNQILLLQPEAFSRSRILFTLPEDAVKAIKKQEKKAGIG